MIFNLLFLIIIFNLIYKKSHDFAYAIITTTIISFSLVVIIAEISSLITGYNIYTITLFWLIAIIFIVKKFNLKIDVLKLNIIFKNNFIEKILISICLILIFLVTIEAIVFVPGIPGDSMVYHLPRAFMYFKRETIHNLPVPYGNMLYLGPLNAILMSHLQILSFGSDIFLNLVQTSAYIIGGVTVYAISKKIGANKTYSLLVALIFYTLPMCILQGSTTQNDLLLTSLCLISIYFILIILKNRDNQYYYMLLGLSCGLATLTKISAGAVLIPFVIAFSLYIIIKDKVNGLKNLSLTLVFALFILIGYWTRNFIDLNGDFLALNYFSFSNLDDYAISDKIALCVKNILFAFTSNLEKEVFLQNIVQHTINLLGSTKVDSIFSYSLFSTDSVTFRYHSFFVLVTLMWTFIYGIIKDKKLFIYSVLAIISIILSAINIKHTESTTRYLLPSITLALPLVSLFLQSILNKSKVFIVVLYFIIFGFFYSACFVMIKDIQTPIMKLFDVAMDHKVVSYKGDYFTEFYNLVLDDISENQYTKIAFDDKELGGVYLFMKEFSSTKFKVEYINSNELNEKEDETFIPESIIAIYDVDEIPKEIVYNGNTYQYKFGNQSAFGIIDETNPILRRTFNYYSIIE